jgi:3-oxoacyl-[acyl-carrier-protein] synthase II
MGRIVVTGMGIITAIGKDAGENFDALLGGRHGIGPVSLLETRHRDEIPAGEIKQTNQELAALCGIENPELYTRTALLGIIAAREAYETGIARYGINDHARTALVSSSTVGGMDKTEQHFYDFLSNNKYAHYVHTHYCSDSSMKICDYLGLRHTNVTISTACSSSVNAILFGAKLIRHGLADRVIAGGTDSLSKFTLNGFNTLMILDRNHCRPLDARRQGLNLGEGAAYIILESEKTALQHHKEILCEISGYANANDAYHQTASSPDGYGPYLSMKEALDMSGLKPSQIDYINAHGTGTDNNDLTEGLAIDRIFAPRVPMVSSTKPFTGHTLAAAGVVETVFSILSIRNGLIFPNLNFSEKIAELSFEPVTELTRAEINHVITNSFGFGGNDSSLVLSKY